MSIILRIVVYLGQFDWKSVNDGKCLQHKVQGMEDHMEHQQKVLQLLKENLNLAKNRMKQQVDQHRSEQSFNVGDWVFLRIKP